MKDLQWLLDLEAIKNLNTHYVNYVDDGFRLQGMPEKVAALFLEDGEAHLNFGHTPPAKGHAAIAGMFAVIVGRGGWARHSLSNPSIEIDGDKASGRWALHAVIVGPGDDAPARTIFGRYEDEYVRSADGWRFESVKFINETPKQRVQG